MLASAQDTTLVRHIALQGKSTQTGYYYRDLLRLALEKTVASDGPYNLQDSKVNMRQGRAIKQLINAELLDVIWTMTSIEREKKLLPVRIPLLKGLLGYRVFLIGQDDQARFSKISTIEQLRSLYAGQGHDWPDTQIMRANLLPVITNSNYEGLFGMLQKRRFDYFPRGVAEAWAEVELHKGNNVMVEQSLMLQYPAPLYFFVNRKNKQLAARLERGLRIALNDGSFDRLFYQRLSPLTAANLLKLEQRKVFHLNNPLLPAKTPLTEKKLWLDL